MFTFVLSPWAVNYVDTHTGPFLRRLSKGLSPDAAPPFSLKKDRDFTPPMTGRSNPAFFI
jgi:hypothetical protein